jgi:FkbM family methyltransferase
MIKKAVYNFLETIYKNKGLSTIINGVTLRLPVRYFRYFRNDYEAENFKFLKENCNPGNIVLDIGAHLGVFAVIAAKYVKEKGKVYAFEPTSGTYNLLKKTIQFNKVENIISPRNEAVGKKIGKAHFYISQIEGDNSNSLISYVNDREIQSEEIDVVSVDSFVEQWDLQKVNFIKIDAEGAEFDVIQGAIKTFHKHRPSCILSIHPNPILSKGDKLEDIYDFITELNYSILYNNKVIAKDEFCINKELIDLHLLPL